MSKANRKPLAGVAIVFFCMAGYPGVVFGQNSTTWTNIFPDETDFTTTGANPFWVLTPGFHQVLEGQKSGNTSLVDITVTNRTHTTADGFVTRVVEEKDYLNGQLIEIAEDYLALSTRTNSVYYFGELSTQYQNGQVIGTAGSWESGVNGARFGMLMPGTALLGARFQQEVAAGVALDRSEILAMGVTIQTPAGTFQNCVSVQDTSGITPTSHPEAKIYCPGIGVVQDEEVLLTKYEYLKLK